MVIDDMGEHHVDLQLDSSMDSFVGMLHGRDTSSHAAPVISLYDEEIPHNNYYGPLYVCGRIHGYPCNDTLNDPTK